MKNYQLIEIKKNWNELKGLSGGKGYYLPLVKNIKKIDIELEAFELIKEKTKGFNEFIGEKDILLRKYAKLDSTGEPIRVIEEVDGEKYYKYDISDENKEILDTEGRELTDKYFTTLKEMMEKEQAYIDTMNAECTISFIKIKECDLPSEMTPELIDLIYDFIDLE